MKGYKHYYNIPRIQYDRTLMVEFVIGFNNVE